MEVIKFENVYYSYEKQTVNEDELFELRDNFALRGVDFSVREGEFVTILGHNGSGKSTLARLINGLLTPTSGGITVFGMDVKDRNNLFEIRKQVGIVFQNPDNQTVASIVEDDVAFGPENIGLDREEIGERITFALDAVGMQTHRHGTPTRLSGGQKQRIAIAGVLALKPRAMILDESTAMLDPRGRKEVMEVVRKLNREENITVILITHFPEEALLADRAVVMHQGKIVLEGTPQSVFQKEDVLESYGLVTPRPIRLCRALTRMGLAVPDDMDPTSLAKQIATSLPYANIADTTSTWGAGMRSPNKWGADTDVGRVVCSNLSHVYNEKSAFETQALEKVDLEIQPGEFFGIIGHTGSGKSTFLQYLNALLKVPTAEKKYKPKKVKKGTPIPEKTLLKVNGYDLTDKSTDFKALRSKVGMVFQYPEYQLFAETVFEDVAFGLKNFRPDATAEEIKNSVREALETVGLSYEEVKRRSPFELSGGQRRRVAIAGVLVTKPEILVLDEPAAGLDPLGKEEIMSLLHKIHNDWCKTIIIVSHDMDEIVENCTRAAVFSEGKVLRLGTPKEVFSNAEELFEKGLDIPFVGKVQNALKEFGVEIESDFTMKNFIEQTLVYAESKGAGMRSLTKGGENHA